MAERPFALPPLTGDNMSDNVIHAEARFNRRREQSAAMLARRLAVARARYITMPRIMVPGDPDPAAL